MSSFSIYKLSNEQQDLFYFNKDGYLNLEVVLEKMTDEFKAPIRNSEILGEGFLNASISKKQIVVDDKCTSNKFKFSNDCSSLESEFIYATVTGAGSLGYYSEAYIEGGSVLSQKKQHSFFSKSDIILTENGYIIAYFESVAAEKIKPKIKALFESFGFEVNTYKITPELLKKVRETCNWTEVKLERIENDEDSTRKVSYEIDITNKDNDSVIDNIYRDKGKMIQISFHMPYTIDNIKNQQKGSFCVKLYNNEHRASLNNNEFNEDLEAMKNFAMYLTNFLLCLTE